jgi:hypothetical protein
LNRYPGSGQEQNPAWYRANGPRENPIKILKEEKIMLADLHGCTLRHVETVVLLTRIK